MSKLTEMLKTKPLKDFDKTLERFMDDEAFYEECLDELLKDEGFVKLGEALSAHKVKESFEYAHMLKGVVANLGITPMFYVLVDIVEPLRVGEDRDLSTEYSKLMELKAEYEKILEDVK